MNSRKALRTIFLFLILTGSVLGLSLVSASLWGGKTESREKPAALVLKESMTLREFGQANSLSNHQLKTLFGLKKPSDLDKPLSSFGSFPQIERLVKQKRALESEEGSKNWIRIVVKFGLWMGYLIFVFLFFRKHKVTHGLRILLHASAVFVFGVALGSDPGPMGTIKDAVVLFAESRVFFPPRVMAMTAFLLMVFLVNKFICAWGCQAGVLQDLLFRLNRNPEGKPHLWKQFKPPFVVTNTVRILLFLSSLAAAFLFGFDLIGFGDIFRVFNPLHLGIAGGVIAAAILALSLFFYRPWCHFFCPFGLAGWLVEKISLVRIRVNYKTCIACRKCTEACPSTVMSAILLRDKKTIPDCFSCYSCRDVCPTGSISFSAGRRPGPAPGFFSENPK